MKLEVKIEKTHITNINAGDTVIINGEMSTISKNNIKSGFIGTSLKGEYFRDSKQIVERVLFPVTYMGELISYQAQK